MVVATDAKLPLCGTCPFSVPSPEDGWVWCHGSPPSSYHKSTDGQTTVTVSWPLMNENQVGCGLHLDWPRPWRMRL
jgi:hypothetical protein